MGAVVTARRAAWVVVAGAILGSGTAGACIVDGGLNSSGNMAYLFPNWSKAEVVAFDTIWCDAASCPASFDATMTGVTIVNYGTANGTTDISKVYLCYGCSRSSGGACTPTTTLTYAGIWNGKAAWTWSGSMLLNGDPCNGGPGGCGCIFVMRVFVDVGPCPNDRVTVQLGPGFDDLLNPLWPGGLTSSGGCAAPWADLKDPNSKMIVYTVKEGDVASAAPGDTVNYTIWYGKPGTAPLSAVTVMDTQPTFTHYVWASGVPAPDPLWDPDWGPPIRLRWTIPGPLPVASGPSSEIRFKLTVDWGNGETFEPGSGDVGAPEGERLDNRATVEFNGTTCGTKAVTTAPTTTVARRFLFWKIGDNDILFSPTLGQPPDEITYEIFLKNMSATRTWWDVRLWDSVPPELDAWCAQCGFDDPCAGWTMTPTGCAAASPGRLLPGAATLLTWRLDMPPGMTLIVRWKGQVKSFVTAGATAINKASLLEYGRPNIINGTGHSTRVKNFVHLAPIILPTTYISYVAFAASDDDNTCPGFFISFSPLNKKTQFELRGLEYEGAGWATGGGVSQSIGCLLGDCLGGFPGSGAACPGNGIPGGGFGGCKAERAPAKYDPLAWAGTCATYPQNFIYKMMSNSPVLWQLLTHTDDDNQDNHTYAPATTLNYTGLMHYMWRRDDPTTEVAGYGDSLSLISTGIDPYGAYVAGLATTVHMFRWNAIALAWDYVKTWELAPESATIETGTKTVEEGPYRTVSSDARLIVNHAMNTLGTIGCCCSQCGDNYGAFMPTRETGNVVSGVGSGTFYGLIGGAVCCANQKMIVGNTGAATATYDIWKYVPDNPVQVGPVPAMLNGTSGQWVALGTDVVPSGLATPGNPQAYWGAFNAGGDNALFKIELTAGGPIQVLHGVNMLHVWGGGAVMHAANGAQSGSQYWLHAVQADTYSCLTAPTQTLNVFCPKANMAIRAQSSRGYSATYTTSGPDQCVSFTALTRDTQNFRIDVLPGPAFGNVIAQYIQCKATEKGYTAPFLQTGTHYVIIAPPTAFAGQSFWITVVVVSNSGNTETDYCGTSSFTSTDPSAKIEGVGMATYDYTWSSSTAPCNNNGAFPDENGVKLFFNVVLNRLGLQTIVAGDTADGSITGLTAIMVVGADVRLSKDPKLVVAASGDTVGFRVCWSNYSSASAFTFVITDAIPMGTQFVPEAGTAAFDCGNTDGTVPRVAYSTTASAAPPASFTENNPLIGTRWLRFTIPMAGVQTTGCVCYRVSVN